MIPRGAKTRRTALNERVTRWAAKWVSQNRLDGLTQHWLHEDCRVVLFRTRAEARAFVESKYGYIRRRPDLHAEPFGWRMPQVVRVSITYQEMNTK